VDDEGYGGDGSHRGVEKSKRAETRHRYDGVHIGSGTPDMGEQRSRYSLAKTILWRFGYI